MSRIHKTILESGVKVIAEEMPECQSSTVGVWVKNGSRDEEAKERGISHFIEHLLFKGTRKRTALDIAKDIESVGGILNAFTSREYTCFYAKVLNKDVPLAMDILSDIFLNSVFDPVELEKERMVVLQEIKMVDDTPDDLIHDLFAAYMWHGHPLGTPVLGSKKTVGSFMKGDVLDYFGRHYHAGNVFISIAGGIKAKNVVKLLEKALKGAKGKGGGNPSTPPRPESGVRLVRKKLEQVHLCIGVPAPAQSHEDRYKLYILNNILGGGMSSRLFQEIREKRGLAYSVYSYLNLMKDAGALVVYAGTSREDFKKVVSLVIKEWKGLARAVGREELKVAREQLKGGMLLGLEASDARMTKLARDEIYFKRVVPVKEIISAIDGVRAADVRELAARLLKPGNISMTAIGRVSENDLPVSFIRYCHGR
ncbi:MAG: insulinase family protein [Deltaproteobacteria bacterium]|nr:insulinase family protein [Deltaproteobacteria bacterium]